MRRFYNFNKTNNQISLEINLKKLQQNLKKRIIFIFIKTDVKFGNMNSYTKEEMKLQFDSRIL